MSFLRQNNRDNDLIKVLVVDDSLIMLKIIRKILATVRLFEVRCAKDPYEARQVIKEFHPDVLTLDIEMPKMDGITFLRNLMNLNPLPVVMLSTLTQKGAEATLVAMELGAIDFIGKPKASATDSGLEQFALSLIAKLKVAAASYQVVKNNRLHYRISCSAVKQPIVPGNIANKIIAIGSSTGGIEAIKYLLSGLSTQLPPIIITQHLPAHFSEKFATRLNKNVNIDVKVKQAEQGEVLLPGHVYIAQATKHLQVVCHKGQYVCELSEGEKVNFHRPSVDVMFNSLSRVPAANLLLVLLTGMGNDGAIGMRNRAQQGAFCIVQDQATSVVWGMPGNAVKLGCVDEVLPLSDIGWRIEDHYRDQIIAGQSRG